MSPRSASRAPAARGGTRVPASRAPGASEPGRPAHPSNRREVHTVDAETAAGRSWLANRDPEDRGRGGRDGATSRSRAGRRSKDLGDDHAEHRRHRAPALREPLHRRPGAPQPLRGAAARCSRPPRRNIPCARPTACSLRTRSWTGRHLGRLTTQTSPTLREGLGIGADTAAEMLILWDNPDRTFEAAFKRCVACPIPASSGMTEHRLPRRSDRLTPGAVMWDAGPRTNPRRTAPLRPNREIIRNAFSPETFQRVMADYRARQAADLAA